jgi:hypothetical protein
MKNLLTGLALLGLGAAAYKYRFEILDEIEGVLPSRTSLKKVANNATKTLASVAQDGYAPQPNSYVAKAR